MRGVLVIVKAKQEFGVCYTLVKVKRIKTLDFRKENRKEIPIILAS